MTFSDVTIRVQLDALRREVEERAGGGCRWAGGGPAPAVDVYETADAVVVVADLPGVAPERLEVTLHERRLVVRGTRPDPTPPGAVRPHRLDIVPGPFELGIRVPAGVDVDAVSARAAHGVLTVTLPKHRD
jgi:HSP20 family protein